MNETIQIPLADAGESTLTHASVQETALPNQEMYDISVERPLVQSTKIALSTTAVHDADGSQGLQIHPSENLLVQDAASIMNDDEETTGSHVTQESIDKPFIQATQTAWDITIIQEKEESYDSDIHLAKNLFNQTITSMAADYKKEGKESKIRFPIHDDQNVLSPTVLYETALQIQDETIERPLVQGTGQGRLIPGIVQNTDGIGNQEMPQTLENALAPIA
ncbi:uncharacterized protein LOC114737238 [Neltuma alba]|uniref:uncharacterized protein LOC114737238 n=1 Tax=Neltuma alba TaxID=207710 RepID=UPI0010A34210|nr:uncharacterized protein LOC114737238 [Prosopis alba]